MALETVSATRSFGGTQGVYKHASSATGTEMIFSVFVPEIAADHAASKKLPVVWYLSGLTCSHANVTEKGEYRRACAELGLIFVAPDTSPRGERVANDDAYDMGQGAGFYVDATHAPWQPHFRMRSYIEQELPTLVAAHFPVDMQRQSIMGHSMGGHGALTIGLRNSARYKAISAFSPICSPMRCPWGEKALTGYLGNDKTLWRTYDACALIEDGARATDLLVDQGSADNFLADQLKPEYLQQACSAANIPLTLNLREGYDHSYYFISSFMENHLRWHAARLAE